MTFNEDGKLKFDSGRVIPAVEIVLSQHVPPRLGYYFDDDGEGYEWAELIDLTYEEKADATNYMCQQWENFRIASIGRGVPGDAYAITHGDGRIELLNK